SWLSSPRLHDDVNDNRLAFLDDIDALLQRRPEIGRMLDGTDAGNAHRIREFGEADVWIADRGGDMPTVHPALTPSRHTLQVHDLLMIGAVVVHDGEHRYLMVRARPDRAGRIHAVAVRLDVHGEAPMFLVRNRGAHRRRQIVSDACTSRTA